MRKALRWGLPLIVLLCVLFPGADGLRSKFAPDDMMNLGSYFTAGWPRILRANVEFWSTFYRPFGGVFYLPIFAVAGLNPLPYRIVVLLLICANTLLVFHIVRMMSRSRLLAAATAVFCGYHASVLDIFYSTSSVYDVLCFFFYFSAFAWYLRARSRFRSLTLKEIAVLLVLYVCSVNSKEIGITLPLALAAYELCSSPRRLGDAARSAGPAIGLLGIVAVVYTAGKLLGSGSLANLAAYRPVYSMERYLDANGHYAASLLYLENVITAGNFPALFSALAILTWWLRYPHLRFAVLFIGFSALPISFIPRRGGSAIYIPLFGYALVTATLLVFAARVITRRGLPDRLRVPVKIAAVVLIAALFVRHTYWRAAFGIPELLRVQEQTWRVIGQVRQLGIKVPPGANVLYLNDPFVDWDIVFITQLVLKDPKLKVWLQRKLPQPLPADAVAGFPAVITTDNSGSLVRIK